MPMGCPAPLAGSGVFTHQQVQYPEGERECIPVARRPSGDVFATFADEGCVPAVVTAAAAAAAATAVTARYPRRRRH